MQFDQSNPVNNSEFEGFQPTSLFSCKLNSEELVNLQLFTAKTNKDFYLALQLEKANKDTHQLFLLTPATESDVDALVANTTTLKDLFLRTPTFAAKKDKTTEIWQVTLNDDLLACKAFSSGVTVTKE